MGGGGGVGLGSRTELQAKRVGGEGDGGGKGGGGRKGNKGKPKVERGGEGRGLGEEGGAMITKGRRGRLKQIGVRRQGRKGRAGVSGQRMYQAKVNERGGEAGRRKGLNCNCSSIELWSNCQEVVVSPR